MKHHKRKLQPIESRYSVIGYCDYIKPAVTSIKELHIIDQGARLFENASGCCLHQDPKSDKCKILLLGGWSDLHQDQIPLDYLKISDHLDMLGVVIYKNHITTRQKNGEIIQQIVKNKTDSWKSGKFLPLSARPYSLNSYVLSKVWYRTACIDVKVGDMEKTTSSMKSWLYQDKLLKPEELLLYLGLKDGGLGLCHLEAKFKASLITSFLQTA